MSEIIYNPNDAGKEITNDRGKIVKVRKYFMTTEEMELSRSKWLLEVSNVDKRLIDRAGPHFFNPYRQGIYYYQIQALFLLGCNKWHNLSKILEKLESYTSSIPIKRGVGKEYGYKTAWDKFRGKSSRASARSCKDWKGRIQENFIFFQRLSRLHPYGYKLHQVRSAVDIKRVDMAGFSSGLYSYRLSTYDRQCDALPIRDFSNFTFPEHENKYVNYKFVGTILTGDKTIVDGVVV